MAATPLSSTCPIRIISVHLLDATGQLLRVLFLDREGHISSQPHYLPREEALILAANQQRVLVIVLGRGVAAERFCVHRRQETGRRLHKRCPAAGTSSPEANRISQLKHDCRLASIISAKAR